MLYKNEAAFAAAHKAGTRYGAVLLYGSEPYLVEQWARTLLGGSADSPFNAQKLDGQNPDVSALWDATEALPLFAEEKTVLLDGLDAAKLSADDLAALDSLLGDLPESTTLVVTAKDAGFGTSANGKKVVKLFDAHGAAVELAARSQADLARFLTGLAKKLNCELGTAAARHLIEICPADMLLLENELRKACAYVGGGEVTAAHIDAVTTPKVEARAFDLQKFILAGNAGKVLGLLGDLFYLREDPIAIMGALSMGFCDLYRARAVKDAGGSLQTMVKDFGYKSEYRAKRAYETAGRMRTSTLRRAVILLGETDRRMKSTPVDNKILLEEATVRLIGLCAEDR